MKGKTILYLLESCNLKMGAMLHIVTTHQLHQFRHFSWKYMLYIYLGLGCLFHAGKVSGANKCYILNFFQKYIHCNTFCSCRLTCPYIYSLCVIFSVSESHSVHFETSLFILFSLCSLLLHQFPCKHYNVTVVVLLLYKKKKSL